jgi:hypothetical protein
MINYKLYFIDFFVHLVILFLIVLKNFNVYISYYGLEYFNYYFKYFNQLF